jgi:hypothetical protein
MKWLLFFLLTILSLCGSDRHPEAYREPQFALPASGEQMKLYIHPATEDGDIRVYWLKAGSENFQLDYICFDEPSGKPWPHGWLKASDLAIQEHGDWLVYYGAPCFKMRWFRLSERAAEVN